MLVVMLCLPAELAAMGQLPAPAASGAVQTTQTVQTQGLSPTPAPAPKPNPDWPNLNRYHAENAALPSIAPAEKRVVFYGDSLTDSWGRRPNTGEFFPGKPYVNRGISGQTTPQMLLRFMQDVVHLQPAAVVVLAGTNDIAGNTGPTTNAMVE